MELTKIDVGVKCVTLETYTLGTCTLRDGKIIFPV